MTSPKPFRALLAASAVSSTGDGLLLVAAPLFAASLTSRPSLVAGAAVATRLPWLLAPLTGALADRFPRARLFVAVEVFRSILLVTFGSIVWMGTGQLWQLYAVAFLLATAETVFAAAALGAVPALVEPAGLQRANGRLYSVQITGEQFVGPALGGAAFAAGAALPFVVDGLSFLGSGALLLAAFPLRRAATLGDRPANGLGVREGVDHLRRSQVLRSLTTTISAFGFCQALVLSTLVLYAPRVLHLSPAGFGGFLAVGAIGNVLGGLVADRIRRVWRAGRVIVAAGVVAAGAYLVAGTTSSLAVAAGAFVAEAVAVSVAMVTTVTLRQRLIPEHLLGRVGGAMRSAVYGAMALGALCSGILAEQAGVRSPLIVAGGLQMICVILFVRPRRRRFDTDEGALIDLGRGEPVSIAS